MPTSLNEGRGIEAITNRWISAAGIVLADKTISTSFSFPHTGLPLPIAENAVSSGRLKRKFFRSWTGKKTGLILNFLFPHPNCDGEFLFQHSSSKKGQKDQRLDFQALSKREESVRCLRRKNQGNENDRTSDIWIRFAKAELKTTHLSP
jgi:hypothetical protein